MNTLPEFNAVALIGSHDDLGSGNGQTWPVSDPIKDLQDSCDFKDAVIESYVALVEKQMQLIRLLSAKPRG